MTDIAGLEMFCLLTERGLHYALKISHSFSKKHNLSLHHSASDSNLLISATSSVAKTLTALPDLAQNKRSLSREQLVLVVSSNKITEKQTMDPLNVFAPDDQCFLQDTKRFYPNRGDKFHSDQKKRDHMSNQLLPSLEESYP